MGGEQSDASWDSDADYPRYCVPGRCRLCRFTIASSETVVAAIDASRLSAPFVYGDIYGPWDKKLQTDFKHCSPACDHACEEREGPALGYHAECLAFASSAPSVAYLRATGYAFEPMPWQDRQRQNRIKHLLAGRLGAIYSAALPAEVWLMVARHLIRPCAITTTETLWAARESSDCCVDMSKDVWAHYVHIDGIRCLAALSNRQEVAGIHSCKLVDAGSVSQSTVLYILEDHLGVRQLVLTGPNASVKLPSSDNARPDPWWRVLAQCPERLEGKSDGLKLRSIDPPTTPIDQPHMLWSLPLQPSDIESLSSTSLAPLKPDRPLEQFQMLPFTLNDPQVTGYSACWSNRLLRLHAHRDGEDMTFYRDLDCIAEQPTWIYIPNEPDEIITDIWFRHSEYYHHLALLFKTNRNRVTQVGPRFLPPDSRFKWSKLCGPLNGPTNMYLNHSERGVHHLAMEENKKPSVLAAPELVPRVNTQDFFSRVSWFYTKAPLSGVAEISPCRRQQPKHSEDDPSPPRPGIRIKNAYSPITGLLLRYSDGSRACVGEFRLDYACAPLVVGDAPRLYLGFTSKVQLHSYMAEIRLARPTGVDGSSLKWLEVDWTGELEWLFHNFACQVFHGDQASLRPF